MSKNYITLDAKPEWQTHYDPKLVGKYLLWHDKQWPLEPGEIIEMKPGAILPMPPSPSLDGFLRWVAGRSLAHSKPTIKSKGSDT